MTVCADVAVQWLMLLVLGHVLLSEVRGALSGHGSNVHSA